MKKIWGIVVATLFLQACAGGLLTSSSPPTPTPDAWLIELQLTDISPSLTPTASSTRRPIPSSPQSPTDATLELTRGISLVELPDETSLSADVVRVEFKWMWNGNEKKCADPPQGQVFEIRVWPDQPGANPLVSLDVSQPAAEACEDGIWTYTVDDLRATSWLSRTLTGRLRWHVALVDQGSHTVLDASESRVFELPPPMTAPTLTPMPTFTPTPAPPPWPASQPRGTIILEQPEDGLLVAEHPGYVELQWRWTGSSACGRPPEGYGFEVRLWPDHPSYSGGPLGAMGDARQNQDKILCEPNVGVFKYLMSDLKETPAVSIAGAGHFRWDVVLVSLDPYKPMLVSGSRSLVIPGQSKLD